MIIGFKYVLLLVYFALVTFQYSISSFVLFSVPSFFDLSKVELANTSKPKPIFFIGVAT